MNFTSFKNWLLERKSETLEYGCLMLYADIPDWKEKTNFIFKDDIYEKDGDYGYEKEPHVTIVYGFHDDELDKEELYEKIKELIRSEKVTIQEISFFEGEDYDVVKFDVPISKQLKEYRKQFLKFPNTQTYKEYHPHMTICYVQKGQGERYARELDKPFIVTFNRAVYSTPEEQKKYFNLK